MLFSDNLWIQQQANELGFYDCGFARAQKLTEDEKRLTQWLNKNHHGEMKYMENYFDQRLNPALLVEDAKTVITLLMNYYPSEKLPLTPYKISSYAYGRDYHEVIRSKLNTLKERMLERFGELHIRGFVDSAPVLERSWAVRSGLGWVGKNGNLITKEQGSFFFIATLITDKEFVYEESFSRDFCGTCNRCVEACPTGAILPGKEIDGSRCISYYTIELKEALISSEKKWEDWIFGCDVCQDVCPWNRFSKPHQEEGLKPLTSLMTMSAKELEDLSEERFREVFRYSPIKRSKYAGLMRNIHFVRRRGNDPMSE